MDVIPLHLGVAHFQAPAAALEALQLALADGKTYYGPTEGTPELRNAIAQRYLEDDGIALTDNQILVTHGTKHALFLFLKCFLKPGDEVVAPAPFWFAFPELVQECGGKLVSILPNPDQHYALPIEEIERSITPSTKLLLLTNPGNPTGKVYSSEEMEKVARLLEKFPQLHLLSDEIYDGLLYNVPAQSFLRFQHLHARISVVNGFSKSFGMSGWRIGYLITSTSLLKKTAALQQKIISGVSPFLQAGAIAALNNRHAIWQEFKADLQPKRRRVADVLNQLPTLSYFLPDAGYYFTVDVKNYLQSILPNSPFHSAEDWAKSLKEEAGLEVLPGTNMGMPTAVRMSFALPNDLLDIALERLKSFVKS